MNEYDAFAQGVPFGGLRSRNDIRLLLCYLLKSIGTPVSRQLLNDSIQEAGLANYFEVNQALFELVESGNALKIKRDDEELYSVTETGRESAELLETRLPRTVREKAVGAALRLLTIYRREKENNIEIVKTDAGYKINIDVFSSTGRSENDRLLSLSLYLADSMQAQRVKEGFLKDPARLCEAIINTLLEEN